jgi:putative membrane-bound dehydrogenase-like protein
MNRLAAAVIIASIVHAGAPLRAAEVVLGAHRFTVPDGFEIEQVTTTNLVQRPVSASFDDRGRLYVTDSSGSNDKPDKQLANPTHRVVRLEDTNGDGRFDTSVVFADKMMFPQGCLWHQGSVYVAGPPSLWKLTDSDDDGVADRREEWFKGGTLTGCANDIHGPYLGLEGCLYWTKGAFAEQTHTLGDGRQLNDRAAHIYRAWPDGSGLDVIMSGGMDNPVGVAFTPEGEAVFTSTFIDFSQPGFRDGIGHAVYGGVFGKANDVVEDGRVKRTGPELLHPFVQLGAAAPSGLCRYESAAFGPAYRDNLFASTFNLHKITRHVLHPVGATYTATNSDFVVSDQIDFHPTDVLEDADGSLLIVDTGGWYKLCCPTSQLAKPDVMGAIYRVRRTGAPHPGDPRGLKIDWAKARASQLAKLLDDERPAVRRRAITALGALGEKAVSTVDAIRRKSDSVEARRNAVWTLAGLDSPRARQAIRGALKDGNRAVRTAAAHVAGLWRDAGAVPNLVTALRDSGPDVKRAAAEALGRIGTKSTVTELLGAASHRPGPMLEHSIIYALIEIGDRSGTGRGLEFPDPVVQRAALIALDQMNDSQLTPDQVIPLLASADAGLKGAASWIVGRHRDWGGSLAVYFRERLAKPDLSGAEHAELGRQLARHARSSAVQELLVAILRDGGASRESHLTALDAMAGAGLKDTPPGWFTELVPVLASDDVELQRRAVAAARSLSMPKGGHPGLVKALTTVGRDARADLSTRLDALATVPAGRLTLDSELFEFVRSNLDDSKSVAVRSSAASILARARLAPEQLLALTDSIAVAGPLELPRLLGAFEKSRDEALGLKLVSALQQVKGSVLRADLLRPLLTNFPVTVQQQGAALLAALDADAPRQHAHLEELLGQAKGGDIRRGQAIFNSAKAACAACHTMGYLGGKLGPDLTSIGQARTERDLLESIVFPSASFVRSYEPVIVVTKSGDEHSGVIRRDGADELVLGTGPNLEVRLSRTDIAEMRPGTVSVMPQGLDEQLTRQELADLVAFLKNTRWGAH